MAFAATLCRNARSVERHAVEIDGTVRDEDRQPIDVSVVDLSVAGFRARGAAGLTATSGVTIGLPGLGVRHALVIRADDGEYGCRFLERLTPAELSATIAAVVTAPIPFPASARQELLLENALPPVVRYPARSRLALLSAGVAASWGLLLVVRLLLG
jgi:hypothetical protein